MITIINNPTNPRGYTIAIRDSQNNELAELEVGSSVVLRDLEIGDTLRAAPKLSQSFPQDPALQERAGVSPRTFDVHYDGQEQVIDAGERFDNRRVGEKRLDNGDANRYSYDLLSIDPFYIDYDETSTPSGGKKKQIFEEVQELDVDWRAIDGDIALKKQLDFMTLHTGEGSTKTIVHNSYEKVSKALTAGIETSAEFAGVAKGKRSGTFSTEVTRETGSKSVFAYSVDKIKSYRISLNEEDIKLQDDFLEEVISIRRRRHCKNLIRDWGTHYPTAVIYGGAKIGLHTFEETRLFRAVEEGLDIAQEMSATVKAMTFGIGGEMSVSESSEYQSVFGVDSTEYKFVGGEGSNGNWSVTSRSAQPIEITLDRISNLLDIKHFQRKNRDITASRLSEIKAMLDDAIDDHFRGHNIENNTIPRPQFFRITIDKWKMARAEDGAGESAEVSGWITVSELYHERKWWQIFSPNPADAAEFDIAWQVNNENRVNGAAYLRRDTGEEVSIGKSYTFHQDLDMRENNVKIYAGFTEVDDSSADDYIGNHTVIVNLNGINLQQGQSEQRSFRIDEGNSAIDVVYTIERLPDMFSEF